MTKRNTSIWLDPLVQRKLKLLGIKWDAPVGDIIEGLLATAETCYEFEGDPEWRKRFWAIFDTCMLNAGVTVGGWRGEEENETTKKARERQQRRLEALERVEAARKAGNDKFLY